MLTNVLTGIVENAAQDAITDTIGGAPLTGKEPLSVILPSTCCDLDATVATSYGGTGQTWANIVPAPPIGAQTDYDFFLGADGTVSTDDPTFTGTADDAAAYFNCDGGDFFQLQVNAGNTNLEAMHKTSGTNSGPTWLCFGLRPSSITSTQAPGSNTQGQPDHGFRTLVNSSNQLRIVQANGGSNHNILVRNAPALTLSTDTLLFFSFDTTSPGGGSEQTWINETTGTSFVTAYAPVATSTTAVNPFQIGASEGGFIVPNNTRIFHFSSGNQALTDTDVTNVINHLELRHNRNYA